MYYCVIHRPEADVSKINEIDAKYDPYHGLVGPHVTLMFPMPSSGVQEESLKKHVQKISSKTQPFNVHINDTELSFDQWLFLVPTIGSSEFNKLHNELYSGEYDKFWRKDLPYSPHIGEGHFGKRNYTLNEANTLPLDEVKYGQALQDIQEADVGLQYIATSIELIGVDDDYKKSWSIENFQLGKNWGEL